MKVFISWSGPLSKNFAEILRQWLPSVIQAAKPYYSPDDITKGTRWNSEIAKELEQAQVGLICVTRDNLNAPWIMFEAGALSKNIENSRVCPILFNLMPADVQGPLVQFQLAQFDKAEMKRVVAMINEALVEEALSIEVLDQVFEMWWPKLAENVEQTMKSQHLAATVVRSERALLEELLQISRSTQRYIWLQVEKRELPLPARSLLVNNYLSLVRAFNRFNITGPVRDYLRELQKPIQDIVNSSDVSRIDLTRYFEMAVIELESGEEVAEEYSSNSEIDNG